MTVSLTIQGITLDKYIQLNRVYAANRTIKGWRLIHIGILNLDSQFSKHGEVLNAENTGTCLIRAARK